MILCKLRKMLNNAREMTFSEKFKGDVCMKKTDFTRNRKLTFADYIGCIMHGNSRSLQSTVDMFIDEHKHQIMDYSKQAFSKGRLRIKPEAFLRYFLSSVECFYEDGKYHKIKGYRVLAIDGTKYNLPNTDELLVKYGSEKYGKDGKTQVQALGSGFYDVLNGMLVDVSINRFDASERDLAINHMEALKENNLKTDKELVLMDRGYPSRKLLAYCEDNGYKYVIRCNKDNFLAAVRDVKGIDETITVQYEDKNYNVRVVTYQIGNTKETLLTNLGKNFTVADLGGLYNMRWKIETLYNDLKNKMEIENFSGKSEIAVLQDFYATMTLSNYASAIEFDCQKKVDAINKDKKLKREYQINRAEAINKLKYDFIEMFLEDSPRKRCQILKKIERRLIKSTTSGVPGRNFERSVKHPSQKFPTNRRHID